MPSRRYDLVCEDRLEDTMKQRLIRQKIRSVSLSERTLDERESPSIYSELTVVKSPRAPMYEVQYVKTKRDGIKQVPVLRPQAKKTLGKGGRNKLNNSQKTDDDKPEVDEAGSVTGSVTGSLTGSVASVKSDAKTDDMVGLRVIACNRKDGLYYPGSVASHLESTYAVVNFNFNKRQKVRTHMIIPMSGAIPRPELAPGDFVLVKVFKQHVSLDCYVPAIIEFVPEDFRAHTKFYSVLMYNGQRASTMRKFIVKIGRSRFEVAVNYIAHIQTVEREKQRALSDMTPRSQDSRTSKTTTDRSDRRNDKSDRKSERSDRSEDGLSDHTSVRSSDRSSVTSGSERGRKKKQRLTQKLVQKQNDHKHTKSRHEEKKSRKHSRSSSRSHSTSKSRSRSRSKSRSPSRSRSRSRSRSGSDTSYSRSSVGTNSSSKKGSRRPHSRSKMRNSKSGSKKRSTSRSNSSSRSRSRSDSERRHSKTRKGSTRASDKRTERKQSRSRRRSNSRSKASSTSRSRSYSSSRQHSSRSRSRTRSDISEKSDKSDKSWRKSRSKNQRRTRSSSGSSTVKSRSRSHSNEDSQDRTPRASPIERPINPVPKPRPSLKSPDMYQESRSRQSTSRKSDKSHRSQSVSSSLAVQMDEKDQVIGDLQQQLNKQLSKQLRQERRLIRQARKINKIQRKLKHSDNNESVASDKTRSVKSSSDTDGSPRRRKESPDGTSYRDSPDMTSMRRSLPGLEFDKEVLCRWSDDGWYYRGRVLKMHENNYIVMDTTGHLEEVSHDDILTEEGHRFDVVQPQECVIALHPKYVFSYAPGEVLHVYDNGNVKVEFYDGSLSKVTQDELYKIPPGKYKKDVDYIVNKEKSLLGKSVVARDDPTGTYRLGVVDSRVGMAQQYYLKWLDGDMCKQSSTHIFEVALRKPDSGSLEHVLAPIDNGCIHYKPAVVLQREPLLLQYCDGFSNTEARREQCFWITKDYYTNAVEFLLSKQSGSRS